MSLTPEQRAEIVRQVGKMNILSISGGRVTPIKNGIELPVSNGYRVRIELTPMDVYTVSRIFLRSAQEFVHGVRENVYCDEVGEIAYRAGMFRSWSSEEWCK